MVRKFEPFVQCKRKCFICHAKRENSKPLVSSFFKVMIGDGFSNVLFLPPKFAPTVSALIDQEIYLEDSNGMKWKVKLTTVENSFAFHQGWDLFASDHGLEIGDFVTFNYIMGSLFVVQIYDRTGCEKLEFSKERILREKAKDDKSTTGRGGPCHKTTSGKNPINKKGSSSSVVSVSDRETSPCQVQMNDGSNTKQKLDIIDVEQDDQISNLPVGYLDEGDEVMELGTLDMSSLPGTPSISCLIVADNQPFLELPVALPSLSSNKRRTVRERRFLLLGDPKMRLWPVLYYETSQLNILFGGWQAFSKVNNIQPGDRCTFEAEGLVEGIFRVSITRKQDGVANSEFT